jgi:hypothetical protein
MLNMGKIEIIIIRSQKICIKVDLSSVQHLSILLNALFISVIRKFRTFVIKNLISKHESNEKHIVHLTIAYQHVIELLVLNVDKMFVISKNSFKFAFNNTCHASHKNSAPGRVFAFYRLLVSLPLNSKAYVVQ